MKTLLARLVIILGAAILVIASAVVLHGQATPTGYPLPKPIPTTGGTPAVGFLKPGAPIIQTAWEDDYAASYINAINGGLHSAATTTERNNMPAALRLEGMVVYVAASKNYYRLDTDLTTWVELPGMTNTASGGGVSGTTNLYTHNGSLQGDRVLDGGNTNTLTLQNLEDLVISAQNFITLDAKDLYLSVGNYYSNLLSTAEQNVMIIDPATGRVDFEPNRAGRAIATATLLDTVNVSRYTNVTTLGRTAVGDGGGGKFWYVAGTPAGHVNNGTVWRGQGNAGNWYYDLGQTRNGLNVLLFEGVRNNGGLLPCDAGLRTAITFCQSPTYGTFSIQTNLTGGAYGNNQYAKLSLLFPPGVYTIGSLTNPGVSMFGALPGAHEGGSYITNGVVILQQHPGVREPMLVFNKYGATISGFTMKGARELTGATNLHLVTSWSSRTNFTYGGSSPASVGVDHHAFFYDALNLNYLGSAEIQSAAGGNAVIYPGTDLYSSSASPPANNEMYVVFAPTVTIDGYTDYSSALAGNPAILAYSQSSIGFNSTEIKDCFIENFHVGVVFGSSAVSRVINCRITQYSFAAIASAFSTVGLTDVFIDSIWAQGMYGGNTAYSDPNSTYVNKYFRNGRFGVFNANGNVNIGNIVIDGTHTGVSVSKGPFSANTINADIMYREAVKFRRHPGLTPKAEPASINTVIVGVPYTSGASYLNATLPADAAGVRINSDFHVSVGAIQVRSRDANNQVLPFVTRSTAGSITIGNGTAAHNATAMRDAADKGFVRVLGATNAATAVNGWYYDQQFPIYQNMTLGVGGTRVMSVYNYGGSQQFVWGDPAPSGQFDSEGLFDYRSSKMVVGSGGVYDSSRGDGVAKSFALDAPVYGEAGTDVPVKILHYDSGVAANQTRLMFGYPSANAQNQAPSRVAFYTAPFDTTIPLVVSPVLGVHTNEAFAIDFNRNVYVNNGSLLVRPNNQAGPEIGSIEAAPLLANAALEVRSTVKAFYPPRMTKAQRDAMTPSDGAVIYQTDATPGLRLREAGAWVKFTTSADP